MSQIFISEVKKNNINGHFLELLKDIYKKSKSAVKINNKLTQFFKHEKGVKQGDPLSPTLFNLYINDLFVDLKCNNNNPVSINDIDMINALMYADDLILLSTSKEGLQNSLNILDNYSKKWKIEVNMKKTKCITFSKGNRKEKNQFLINGKLIENCNEYKYLGVVLNKKGMFTPTLSELSCKANKAIYAMRQKINIRFLSIKTQLKLFDSLISPILLYASEVWEPYLNQDYTKWETTLVEKVHTQFIKRMLGINRSTTNLMVRGDTGRIPLKARIISRNIKYINEIKNKGNNTLVKQAYVYESMKSGNRISILSSSTDFNDKLNNLLSEEVDIFKLSYLKIKNYIKLVYRETWKEGLLVSSKTDCYKEFKTSPDLEKYFELINNSKNLNSFTKFRLSDHKLMIEEGRKKRPIIPRNERLCKICKVMEDEKHFLMECNIYNEDRMLNFAKIQTEIPGFANINNNDDKFIFLMTQENKVVTNIVASCINKWFKVRNDIMEGFSNFGPNIRIFYLY